MVEFKEMMDEDSIDVGKRPGGAKREVERRIRRGA